VLLYIVMHTGADVNMCNITMNAVILAHYFFYSNYVCFSLVTSVRVQIDSTIYLVRSLAYVLYQLHVKPIGTTRPIPPNRRSCLGCIRWKDMSRSHMLNSFPSLFYSLTTKFDTIFYKTKKYCDMPLYMVGKIRS